MFPALLVVIMVVMVMTLRLRTQIYFQCWEAPSRLLFFRSPEGGAPDGQSPRLSSGGLVLEKPGGGGSAAGSLGPVVGMVVAVGPRVAHRWSSPGGASPSPLTEQTPVPLASDSSWVSLTGVGFQLCL